MPANNGEDIALAIPDSLYAGTVLSSATVSVTSQKDACPAPNYEQQTGKHTEVINSIPFDVTTGTGVGAGNLYESSIYNTVHNGVCHSIVLLRHSCNLGPDCGEGHTKPYNKKAVNEALMSIVRTFAF
ncbi:MAG: hypothetical protein JWM56_452 [Candidatus Peribacteria bacterium]|nr:hypothetical protein [Candidatus Peribacteria bacterium]